ncbi:MAG: sugar phosphate isomerase/epimerase [Pseudomonadota bacterium]
MTAYSYQLYSSREFPPLPETLSMLADLGYQQVEGFGGLYDDPKALRAALDAAGLAMPTGHFGLDMLENDPDRVLEIASTTGMEAIYCPHIGPELRPDNGPGWREFGERVQAAGAPVRDAGLIYGWHNHDFEFGVQSDGSTPMGEILAGGPDLSWEVDIAWIVRGGGDPLSWMSDHADRISAIHIKDIAPAGECADEDGWADVGHGTMGWPTLLNAARNTACKWFVMEHDKPNDHARFAKRSIATTNQI